MFLVSEVCVIKLKSSGIWPYNLPDASSSISRIEVHPEVTCAPCTHMHTVVCRQTQRHAQKGMDRNEDACGLWNMSCMFVCFFFITLFSYYQMNSCLHFLDMHENTPSRPLESHFCGSGDHVQWLCASKWVILLQADVFQLSMASPVPKYVSGIPQRCVRKRKYNLSASVTGIQECTCCSDPL